MTGPPRHVVLVGLMASGKSTVGPPLGARLGRGFVDNDAALEKRTGRSARAIEAADGTDVLHAREAEALVAALAEPVPVVIAAAAAAPPEANAGGALRAHFVVYLRVRPEILAARIAAEPDDGHRPFLVHDAPAVLAAQFAARDEPYRALATLVVDASGDDPHAIVEVIVAEISSGLAP